MLIASVQSSIGLVILFASLVISITYAWINIRQSRPEIGSEIELAPNRKPYYSDEELEGPRLDRVLAIGLVGLFVIAITLPLYWLNEPARQEGARQNFNDAFVKRGAAMFETTANGGFDCAFCHGGMDAKGNVIPFTVTDANGQFVEVVQWKAPALDTVFLRYTRDEIRYVLVYGRTFSPMPPWGVEGGGPLNDQQLQNLISYMETIQVDINDPDVREEFRAEVDAAIDNEMQLAEDAGDPYATRGEAMFNLGYYSNYAGGAFACARCHTSGWSSNQRDADGNGALGPSLRGGVSEARFPGPFVGFDQQVDFVCTGSEVGQRYGSDGQGTGRMPGFCSTPAEAADPSFPGSEAREASDPATVGGMYTLEDVQEIVRYVRSL